jgi:hypothetical protein
MRSINYNKKCQCATIITKQHDAQSKKMLQAQMLKSPKSYKLKYNNSANDTLIQNILSNDFNTNKKLLFCYKIDRYTDLISPLIPKFPKIRILGLLDDIIVSLTQDEYNIVFKVKIDMPIILDAQLVYENKKTFYVITADLFGYNSFVFKNYTNDYLIPTYKYTFDLSDTTNAEIRDVNNNIVRVASKLCFSIDKNWIPYTFLTYSDEPPGTPGAYVSVNIPSTIKNGQLYIYNDADVHNAGNYILWGHNISKLNIVLDTIKETIKPICVNKTSSMTSLTTSSTTSSIMPSQKIPNIDKINTFTDYDIVCMPQSSILFINNFFGANLYIEDVLNKYGMGSYSISKYGLYGLANNIYTYYLYIPYKFALAFINDDSDYTNFSYIGEDSKKYPNVIIDGTSNTRDFYYGTITIIISGSFKPMSMYTKNYGYLNCKDIIIYSETCSSISKEDEPYLIPYE